MNDWAKATLDLIKSSGWQTGAITAAATLFLVAAGRGLMPPLEPWMAIAATAIGLLAGCLFISSMLTAIWTLILVVAARVRSRMQRRNLQAGFRKNIPYLTDVEKQIFGYLLQRKEKHFLADHDGGYAAALLARGYVRYIGQPGQSFMIDQCPMAVPDLFWEVLEENKHLLPYQPKVTGRGEVAPWRIPSGF